MSEILNYTFLISLLALIYTWIIYPMALSIIARFRKPLIPDTLSEYPSISIIIAAYNEATVIASRIENLLEQNYPLERIEIIVASDGSKDNTVEIANHYKEVKVLDFVENRGRASVHNDAVAAANGDILLFTDAETVFIRDFLRNSVCYLQNPEYGCGAGDFSFVPQGAIGQTENLYWRMEKKMRWEEYKLGILPFASGGCFLIRKEYFEPIASHSDIDNILPLLVLGKGKKIFYASDAKAHDITVSNVQEHYRKRVRTAQRSMTDIFSCFPMLLRAKKFIILFVLVSHRLIRWMSGYFGMGLLVSSVGIYFFYKMGSLFWLSIVALQAVFYLLCIFGWLSDRGVSLPRAINKVAKIVYSFLLANLAFTIAISRIVAGHRIHSYNA